MAALVLFLIANWNTPASERSHETGDAYMRADLTGLSTKIGGPVAAAAVSDYQPVNAGRSLIATIRTKGARLMPEIPR
jgi:multidrug resistance efflux pump